MNKNDKQTAKVHFNKRKEAIHNKNVQTRKMKEEIGSIEDSTKYGEFVSSYFAWMTLEGQKERAEKLQNITKRG